MSDLFESHIVGFLKTRLMISVSVIDLQCGKPVDGTAQEDLDCAVPSG